MNDMQKTIPWNREELIKLITHDCKTFYLTYDACNSDEEIKDVHIPGRRETVGYDDLSSFGMRFSPIVRREKEIA